MTLTVKAYAHASGLSLRQVQRYLAENRLPGAVKASDGWRIPSGTVPLPHASVATSGDVAPTSRPNLTAVDVATPSYDVSPLGALGTLQEAADVLGTTTGGVRRMAADGLLVVGRYGPRGSLRVYVAPR